MSAANAKPSGEIVPLADRLRYTQVFRLAVTVGVLGAVFLSGEMLEVERSLLLTSATRCGGSSGGRPSRSSAPCSSSTASSSRGSRRRRAARPAPCGTSSCSTSWSSPSSRRTAPA